MEACPCHFVISLSYRLINVKHYRRKYYKKGGHARKGNGRNFKLGEPNCDDSTIVGMLGRRHGHRNGDSVYDPVFIFAAVLDWAGIVRNERGELVLAESYRRML